jgi:predicted metal-dependent hydrolase
VELKYEIQRSARRTISLLVNQDLSVLIKAPLKCSEQDILLLLDKKKNWIAQKQKIIINFHESVQPISCINGNSLLYLGNSYTIIIKKQIDKIKIEERYIIIPENWAVNEVINWLKDEAKKIFKERCNYYCNIMGTRINEIKLSNAQKRWGSCSPNGNIQLSWRLVMCPLFAVDYVVVHELSHLEYKNHGSLFWARIATILPDYKDAQTWLEVNRGIISMGEDW